MRVLMSGFTALQVSVERKVAITKIDGPAGVAQALREAGHQVDWRLVRTGEDLSGYDLVWLNMAPINSLNARKGGMGAAWALSQRLPTVAFFDDWQFEAVFRGMKTILRAPRNLYKYMIGGDRQGVQATHYSLESAELSMAEARDKGGKPELGRFFFKETDETVKPYEPQLLEALRSFVEEPWYTPVVPAYRWGDKSIVRTRMDAQTGSPMAGINALDLSPIIFDDILSQVEPTAMEAKEEAFLLAALMPHGDWLAKKEISWPVRIVGSQKMQREQGGERLKTEVDVLQRYNGLQAALSPSYSHAGSGWWRSRFLYCARVGSVLVCDRGEADALGTAYAVTPAAVEQATVQGRADMASAQREALRPWITGWDQFVAHCDDIVRRTVG